MATNRHVAHVNPRSSVPSVVMMRLYNTCGSAVEFTFYKLMSNLDELIHMWGVNGILHSGRRLPNYFDVKKWLIVEF